MKRKVSFGCRATLEQAAEAAALGFDFFEAPVSSLQPDAKDEVFASIRASFGKPTCRPQVFHDMMPPDLPVLGKDVPYAQNRRWIRHSIQRAKRLGGKLIVLHSPKAREIPPDLEPHHAKTQLTGFVRVLSEYAAKSRMFIALDPLTTSRNGAITSLAEAAALAEESGVEYVCTSLDVTFGCDSPEGVPTSRKGQERLCYIRVLLPDAKPDVIERCSVAPLFRSLKQIGFAGRVCLLMPGKNTLAPSPEFSAWLRAEWKRS